MQRVFSDPDIEKTYQELKDYVRRKNIDVKKLFEKPLKFEDPQ